MDAHQLEQLRSLGKLEIVSSACHHLGFYNNVGLSAHYRLTKSISTLNFQDLIYRALERVINDHAILSAIPVGEDTPSPYFARLPSIDLKRSVKFIDRHQQVDLNGAEDKELDAILQDQANINFKQGYGDLPFWRLLIVQIPGVDNEFTASFIFHHAIGDGVSGLTFHATFLSALLKVSALDAPVTSDQQYVVATSNAALLPPLEDLHPLPLPPAVAAAATSLETKNYKEWTGGIVQYPCKTLFRSLCFSQDASSLFLGECKKRNLTVTAGLTSLIASSLFDSLPRETEALTCIIPVSLRPWLFREIIRNGIGTWIDAFKVKVLPSARDGPKEDRDIWQQAHETSKQIQTYLKNTSPTGEPYTGVAIFKTIPDVSPIFQGALGNPRDAAFELSNLGVMPKASESIPTRIDDDGIWQVGKVTFSRSAVVSGSALTVNVVTGGDGRMTLGFTWQEGVVDDSLITSLITGIGNYLDMSM